VGVFLGIHLDESAVVEHDGDFRCEESDGLDGPEGSVHHTISVLAERILGEQHAIADVDAGFVDRLVLFVGDFDGGRGGYASGSRSVFLAQTVGVLGQFVGVGEDYGPMGREKAFDRPIETGLFDRLFEGVADCDAVVLGE
jgi:hypothetical protein